VRGRRARRGVEMCILGWTEGLVWLLEIVGEEVRVVVGFVVDCFGYWVG
jgi:hypothetical protein